MDEHTEILPQLAAYHDGELTAADRQKLKSHLEICSACRQRLADWSALDTELLKLPEPGLAGDGLLVETLAEIKRRVPPISRQEEPTPQRAWVLRSVAAAAVILLAAIGIMKMQSDDPQSVAETTAETAPLDRDLPVETAATATDSDITIAMSEADIATALQSQGATVTEPETPASKVVEGQSSPAQRLSEPAQINPAPAYAKLDTTAPVLVAIGDSGIPQFDDWSARLFDSLKVDPDLRLVGYQPTDFVELNVVPEFDADFVGISYAIQDLLEPGHEATLVEPQQLGPEQTYLVSNLRMERAALMARSQNQIISAEVTLRLAEVTWRLANITADRDDVRSAIVAQTAAMRRQPQMTSQAKARLAHLEGLID